MWGENWNEMIWTGALLSESVPLDPWAIAVLALVVAGSAVWLVHLRKHKG
ncbi:MAG: hypothetical protein AAF384_16130 [Pseudomonadota bacterium]